MLPFACGFAGFAAGLAFAAAFFGAGAGFAFTGRAGVLAAAFFTFFSAATVFFFTTSNDLPISKPCPDGTCPANTAEIWRDNRACVYEQAHRRCAVVAKGKPQSLQVSNISITDAVCPALTILTENVLKWNYSFPNLRRVCVDF